MNNWEHTNGGPRRGHSGNGGMEVIGGDIRSK